MVFIFGKFYSKSFRYNNLRKIALPRRFDTLGQSAGFILKKESIGSGVELLRHLSLRIAYT